MLLLAGLHTVEVHLYKVDKADNDEEGGDGGMKLFPENDTDDDELLSYMAPVQGWWW